MATTLGTPSSSVTELLFELHNNPVLQSAISQVEPDDIVLFCQERNVFVNGKLLKQFLSQLEVEESTDVELSLEQLEDVDGGLGVADIMVSGAVLAVAVDAH